MYVEAYETLSSQIKVFTTCVVLLCLICDRILFFVFYFYSSLDVIFEF